ncbi:SDR family oxidoreductase [Salinarimonas soli]|uniref:SDR family oxidoreductase n=1 Tax=Salinarimonas soli TaxID=1638099 RepID=A0A5B2VJ36_9HYPH|nr:SDR family oxidoreductase [Salinarimonas soli]KAA2238207.1 SDR family oxidoreductase [Salinarimonas soli]
MSPPVLDLKGQPALVTGASSGIGLAVAKGLARAGARVAVNYHSDREGGERIARAITDEGGTAIAVGGDVSREEDVERIVAETVAAFGTLHILVANAGLQRDAAFHEMSLDDWRRVIDVNLTGQFLCARAAVREFLRRGREPEVSRALGKIVCISSVHEVIPWAGHVNYAASKGGVMLMMKSLAQEVAEQGIRVNSIAPGAIRTPINREAWETPQAEAALLRLIPYGRVGDPDDIAKAAIWLASDESDYVTGASLFVDGGMTLYPGFRDGG